MNPLARARTARPAGNGLIIASLVTLVALAQEVRAVPVTYELDVVGANASGSLGNMPFSSALLFFVFEGDTSTVIPFSVPTPAGTPDTGYLNLTGTATVTIRDATGALLGQGTFLPSAGIYVSVDNSVNHGIGFGSFGVPPSDPSFPGQPVYPASMLFPAPDVLTYDLKSNFNTSGSTISCVGFPTVANCLPAIPLPTTSGAFLLNQLAVTQSFFSATTQPVIVFTNLDIHAEIETSPEGFELEGGFTLGAGSNGINPLSEAVTLQLDAYSVTIPPGSFTRSKRGGYEFQGKIGGVALQFAIRPQSATSFRFDAEGEGSGFAQLTSPVLVQLTIGDDSGKTSIPADYR